MLFLGATMNLFATLSMSIVYCIVDFARPVHIAVACPKCLFDVLNNAVHVKTEHSWR
jgi:hypothetical protein